MTQASAQDGADGALRREWDKQSIYLRLQEGIPTAFWVSGDLVSPSSPAPRGQHTRATSAGGVPTRRPWLWRRPLSPGWWR